MSARRAWPWRSARTLAEDFPDGVWLVELAPVDDPDAVPDAIATVLGIAPQGGARIIDTVADAVAGRRMLLVVDNCEHVLTAAAEAIGDDPDPLRRSPGPGDVAGAPARTGRGGRVGGPPDRGRG